MAKPKISKSKKTILIRLLSTAGTGTFYVKRVKKAREKKMQLKKFDKKIKQHVLFNEQKIK
jgi:large subunit ribosomal protein L33